MEVPYYIYITVFIRNAENVAYLLLKASRIRYWNENVKKVFKKAFLRPFKLYVFL
jgi:hypothetical protein